MKLREAVRKKQGTSLDLGQFHDGLMRQGFAPIKVIRETVLRDDSQCCNEELMLPDLKISNQEVAYFSP